MMEQGQSVGSVSARPSPFSEQTFDLLAQLHEEPKRTFYLDNKDRFKEYLEKPFQQLVDEVGQYLPQEILTTIETESDVYARILKNDYGQGGAWDFYWAAFHPLDVKRTEGPQLFVWMNHEHLRFGYSMGRKDSQYGKMFEKNCRVHQEEIFQLLGRQLADGTLEYGERRGITRDTNGSTPPEQPITWDTWLTNPGKVGINVAVTVPKNTVLHMSTDDLVPQITAVFVRLYPLVLLAISEDPLHSIRAFLGESNGGREPYTLERCAKDTGFTVQELKRWVDAIDRKGQAILYGPPGTGKTFLAEKLAQHLKGNDGYTDLVQFHPAYAYEDFMVGIRPQSQSNGALHYPLVDGRFVSFCKKAEQYPGRCVLIIDEINRANLARVFGELMYLLEYRDREIPLAGGRSLRIPKNVRIIGTMNTADRSIALVDYALRRRFAFLELTPRYEILRSHHASTGFDIEGLIGTLEKLNSRIGDRHYAVGISFFLKEDLQNEIEDIWKLEIEPYLTEYFFDQPSKADEFRWDKIRGAVFA